MEVEITQTDGHFTRLLNRTLNWIGIQVARHPWKIIAICLLLTIICSVKTVTTKKQSDLLAYAPIGARSRVEHSQYQEFFGRYGQGVMTYVLIEALDNGTMLRLQHLNETVKVLDHISKKFKIYNSNLDQNQSFDEFCNGFCQLNEPVRQFYNGFVIQQSQLQSNSSLNPRIHLNYPTTSLFGRKFTIQANFFGVNVYSQIQETDYNHVISNMRTVRMIVFQFRADKEVSWLDEAVVEYEMAIAEHYKTKFRSENIRVLVISPSYVSKEIERGGMELQPLLIVGFGVMCGFTMLTTVISSAFVNQFSFYKIILALAACIVPLLSCVTAFGLSFFCGLRFSPLIAITPFLVLAIGVDDSFLLISAWQRSVQKTRKRSINNLETTEHRMAMVCKEAGPSICLSSTTNILAFLIGATMSTPEIQLFSIVTAIAILIDTLYSLILYPAIMSLCDRAETRRNSIERNEIVENKTILRVRQWVHETLDEYVRILTAPFVSFVIVVSLVVFLIATGWAATQMTIDLSSEKFFLRDSEVLTADALKQRYVVPAFTAPTFIVNNPGNLSDKNRIKRLENLVQHLEQLPDAIGRDSTKYFYRDFKDYLVAFLESESEEEDSRGFNISDLESFLRWPEYSFWRGFLRFRNDTETSGQIQLEKFFFTTGYSGDRLFDWSQRHTMLDEWRRAVDQFQELNVSVYYEDALFLDLIDVLPASNMGSAVSTLICIILVVFMFVGNYFITALSSLSVFSICLGQFGLLQFCGFTLDPIMSSALILTIGLSIDIPAHFCYHYHRTGIELEDNDNIRHRLKATLLAVGFPVFQAGISTILCVMALLLVPLYMGVVFVVSLTLCISLSLIHALLIIPALLTVWSQLKVAVRNQNKSTVSRVVPFVVSELPEKTRT